MKLKPSSVLTTAVAVSLATAAFAAIAGQSSVNVPVTQLTYSPTGISDGVHGELSAAPAYGDLKHGAHSTFIKMPAGFVSPAHIHSADYYAVVLSGVAVNAALGGAEVPLPVGSYWLQKGGESHITKCISSNECIFFISQNGKFDFVPNQK